jgi:putative FmdB family regulatory protein
MTTYEYRCSNDECPSGGTFECQQKMTDDALTYCPHCGADCSRVISGGQGIVFKGEGWVDKTLRAHRMDDHLKAQAGRVKQAKQEGRIPGDAHITASQATGKDFDRYRAGSHKP